MVCNHCGPLLTLSCVATQYIMSSLTIPNSIKIAQLTAPTAPTEHTDSPLSGYGGSMGSVGRIQLWEATATHT